MHVLALERGLVQNAENQRRRVWGRMPDTVRTLPPSSALKGERSHGSRLQQRP